jgi:hypothetical protein
MGHEVFIVLLPLLYMAGGAIVGTHYHMDIDIVVVEGVGMLVVSQGVALGTAYGIVLEILGDVRTGHFQRQFICLSGLGRRHLGMPALFPTLDDTRMDGGVTVEAFLCGIADRCLGNGRYGDDDKGQGNEGNTRHSHVDLQFTVQQFEFT